MKKAEIINLGGDLSNQAASEDSINHSNCITTRKTYSEHNYFIITENVCHACTGPAVTRQKTIEEGGRLYLRSRCSENVVPG